MTDAGHALVWFRNDLRLADNPALHAATTGFGKVTALFVHERDDGLRPIGAAADWWLRQSLKRLAADLGAIGIPLEIVEGNSASIVPDRVRKGRIDATFWNRRYSPAQRSLDTHIKSALAADNVDVRSFNASLLVEPFDIATGSGKPYAVFTPFWKSLRQRDIPVPLPRALQVGKPIQLTINDASDRLPNWAEKLAQHWTIGEAAAQRTLHEFLDHKVRRYPAGRDLPGHDLTARLSPHLHFGEIGPRQVWLTALAHAAHTPDGEAVEKFLSELAWRDFSYHLLYHRPDIANVPMQAKYEALPWRDDDTAFRAWQQGRTGFPIVDAGLRQLWATGWMHNRVRMLVASLLAKNLMIDWRAGERWFWDTLVDADDASNPASWQWVAGCGADAAPYFRIFNPVLQGEKFDPDGAYVRQWVPELAKLPNKWLQRPYEAPAAALEAAQLRLGADYPRPIVDLGRSRSRALEAFAAL